uniref:Uncharacterized protein n=1 Tax=Arundo donax TaxID=35708 RepID=A0A0A9ATB4_ARUDO
MFSALRIAEQIWQRKSDKDRYSIRTNALYQAAIVRK